MPFTEVDAAHYLGQVLRRQLWQEQSLFYSGKSSKSTVQPPPPPEVEVILTVLPRASLTRTIRLYDQLCLYCYIVRN